jgi:hypothetical protein
MQAAAPIRCRQPRNSRMFSSTIRTPGKLRLPRARNSARWVLLLSLLYPSSSVLGRSADLDGDSGLSLLQRECATRNAAHTPPLFQLVAQLHEAAIALRIFQDGEGAWSLHDADQCPIGNRGCSVGFSAGCSSSFAPGAGQRHRWHRGRPADFARRRASRLGDAAGWRCGDRHRRSEGVAQGERSEPRVSLSQTGRFSRTGLTSRTGLRGGARGLRTPAERLPLPDSHTEQKHRQNADSCPLLRTCLLRLHLLRFSIFATSA